MTATPYQVMPPLADAEYDALKASIAAGYDPARPIVVDENGAILDGHHRQQACAELGITPPTITLPGLTEDQKHDYAMRANLAQRHLNQEQKRELIRAELNRNPDRSDREIGRLCGVDHKTVGAVRRGEIPHPEPEDAYLAERARAVEILTGPGAILGLDPSEWADDIADDMAQTELLRDAARSLLRSGAVPLPPDAWWPTFLTPDRKRSARTALTAMKNNFVRERYRLNVWDILVQLEAGEFLNWCDAAGIDTSGPTMKFPERLRYPDDTGVAEILRKDHGWTPDVEHQAARGHFYLWWYTRDELAEICGGAA
jgi:site-specific DNA-methyltransferase (adenine-specific)